MTSNPFIPNTWQNQYLILYHGTLLTYAQSILTNGINLSQGRVYTDFGQGFYTTTVERQARAWAWQLAQRRGGLPAVIRFDADRDSLAQLDCLWFVRGNFDADDFWSLVFHCRNGGTNHNRTMNQGWYDVVIGPVAASWRQRLSIYDADQVSFHTPRAVALLNNSQGRLI